jgi:hypothetical protein
MRKAVDRAPTRATLALLDRLWQGHGIDVYVCPYL